MNKTILLLCITLGISLTACSQKSKTSNFEDEINMAMENKGEDSNSSHEGDGEPDSEVKEEVEETMDGKDSWGYQSEKIDMREVAGRILYNPYEGKMTCITSDMSEDGNQVIYSIKVLNDEQKWVGGGRSWTVEYGTFSLFEYSLDGELYALEEKAEGDAKDDITGSMYTLYKWLKDGSMETVPLERLNDPMETNFMKNLYLEEENEDERIRVYITSMKVLEDNTMAIFYSNASMRVYDLASGKELKAIEVEVPIDTVNMVINQDEIITKNEYAGKNNMALDVIDVNTGGITRNIMFGDGVYERGLANWAMLCKGTEDDFYLLAAGGIFRGDWDCSEMDRLVDQSVMGDPPELGYQYFAKGEGDDYYVTYYEVTNTNIAPQDQVAELQMIHYY